MDIEKAIKFKRFNQNVLTMQSHNRDKKQTLWGLGFIIVFLTSLIFILNLRDIILLGIFTSTILFLFLICLMTTTRWQVYFDNSNGKMAERNLFGRKVYESGIGVIQGFTLEAKGIPVALQNKAGINSDQLYYLYAVGESKKRSILSTSDKEFAQMVVELLYEHMQLDKNKDLSHIKKLNDIQHGLSVIAIKVFPAIIFLGACVKLAALYKNS